MYTLTELIAYLGGSTTVVAALFVGGKFIYAEIIKKQDAKKAAAASERDKAYLAICQLYENQKSENKEVKQENKDLKLEIAALKKGDSLSETTMGKFLRALQKISKQVDIIDTIFIQAFFRSEPEPEKQQLREAIRNEMDILKQRCDEANNIFPQ